MAQVIACCSDWMGLMSYRQWLSGGLYCNGCSCLLPLLCWLAVFCCRHRAFTASFAVAVAEVIGPTMAPDVSLIVGAVIDESIRDETRIAVAATCFGDRRSHLLRERSTFREPLREPSPALDKGMLEVPVFLRGHIQRPRRPFVAFTALDQILNMHRCLR